MKECTYYDLLGIPMDATDEEIINAKNFLVKKFHPDANMDNDYDTTSYIQNILYAYRILSDPKQRRVYDRRIRNPIRRDRTSGFSDKNYQSGPLSPNFAPYWEAANRLNELVASGIQLLNPAHKLSIRNISGKPKQTSDPSPELKKLAEEADVHIRVLESGNIPREYWFSHAMNWLLFQWSQNRDFPYAMLYSMYDSYLEQQKSNLEKRKILNQANTFLSNLDKIMSCKKISL